METVACELKKIAADIFKDEKNYEKILNDNLDKVKKILGINGLEIKEAKITDVKSLKSNKGETVVHLILKKEIALGANEFKNNPSMVAISDHISVNIDMSKLEKE